MQKYLFLLILFIPGLVFAQLVDSNCSQFIKEQDFIKGSTQKSTRTERSFSYPKIIGVWDELRHKVQTGENLSTNCYGQVNYSQCVGFQMYCTEKIMMYALQEDLEEWTAAVNNCQDPNYLEKYPDHCLKDHTKSLEYILNQAQKIGLEVTNRNGKEDAFSSGVFDYFSKFQDNPAALLAEKKEEAQIAGDRKSIMQLIDQCHGVTLIDDKDVKDRQITEHLHNSFACMMPEPMAIDTVGASAFRKDLSGINEWAHAKVSFPKFVDHALTKSLEAMWSNYLQQYGAMSPGIYEYTCKKIPVLCLNSQSKGFLESAIVDFENKQKENPIEYRDYQKTKNLIDNDLNPRISEFQKVCGDIHKEYKEIEEKYACIPKIDFKNPKPIEKISVSQCERMQEERYYKNKYLLSRSVPKIKEAYRNVLNSSLGHLFLTDSMKNGVGSYRDEFVYEECMKGSGQGLRKTDWNTINRSQKEFHDLTINNLSEIANDKYSPKKSESDLYKKYVKQHFIEMAEFLWDNPEEDHAIAICNAVRSLYRNDYNRRILDGVLVGSGAVATIALMATGVGSAATPFLWGALGVSTAAQVGSSFDHYLTGRNDAKLTAGAASAGQIELEFALEKIRKDLKESDSQMDAMITILALEATGLGLAKSVALFNRLKNSPLLIRLVRGKNVLNQYLDVKDLTKIRSGLISVKKQLQAKGFSPRLLDNLSGEELAELGARISKMPEAEVERIFMQLNPKFKQSFGRNFLAALRKEGKFNVDELNRMLASQPKLSYPQGVQLQKYLDKSHMAIQRTQPISTRKVFQGKVAALPDKSKTYVSNYIKNYGRKADGTRDVWSVALRSTFLKPRQQIVRKSVLDNFNSLHKINDFIWNPIASTFNTSKQVTMRFQMAMWIGFDSYQAYKKNKNVMTSLENAADKKESIPGGEYSWAMLEKGLLDPAKFRSQMVEHSNAIDIWVDGEGKNWQHLPRLAYLKSKLGLTDDEAKRVSELAWESYKEEIQKVKAINATGTKEERALFHELIIENLNSKLTEDSKLNRLSPEVRDALWSVYHPVLKLREGFGNDVDWVLKFSDPNDEEVRRVYPLFEQGASFEEAISLMIKNRDSKTLAKKQEKVKTQLPQNLQGVGSRGDFSINSYPKEFGLGGTKIQLKDEIDRWKLLSSDSRFKEVYELFNEGHFGEYQVMEYIEKSIDNYNQIYNYIADPKTASIDELMINNPLLSSINSDMLNQVEKLGLDETKYLELRNKVLNIWLDYYKKQATGESPVIEDYIEKYSLLFKN